jgi:archaemetzincin
MSCHRLKGIIFATALLMLASCRYHSTHSNRVIVVQPFADFSLALTDSMVEVIKKTIPNTIVRGPIDLPVQAYTQPRNRYRADTLIRFLNKYGCLDTVIIGFTNKDISATKGNISDWGIMGLGDCPGNACVVSTYRISKTNLNSQFYKLIMHELGHTQGLPHCSNKTCFMRDAEGGNPIDEEKGFCEACKSYLVAKGWKFNKDNTSINQHLR